MSKLYLGIDLGGTNIKIGCFDESMKLIGKGSESTNAEMGPEFVVDAIARCACQILGQCDKSMDDVVAVGIGTPGPVDLRRGVVIAAPNLPSFRNTPIRDMVSEKLGKPTTMENDANAACWGEHVIGAGRGVKDMIFLTLGTGIGGGILSNGQLVHGSADGAAELGHIIIHPEGRKCGCGQLGCAEAYASAKSTAIRAKEQLQQNAESSLKKVLADTGDITCKDVYEHAQNGDKLAIEITEGTASVLGLLCVSLLHVTEPQRIVFAGGMIAAGDFLIGRIQHYFNKYIWPMKSESLELRFATLGEDAGIIGNASLAMELEKKSL